VTMPDKLLVALVNSLPGEEDAFNAWYAEHMREVAGVPGMKPGTRYRLSDVQAPGAAAAEHSYLTVYEIDGEIPTVLGEIAARRARGDWTPRRGIDNETIRMWAFERIADDGQPV
jgi:hypothetical protein